MGTIHLVLVAVAGLAASASAGPPAFGAVAQKAGSADLSGSPWEVDRPPCTYRSGCKSRDRELWHRPVRGPNLREKLFGRPAPPDPVPLLPRDAGETFGRVDAEAVAESLRPSQETERAAVAEGIANELRARGATLMPWQAGGVRGPVVPSVLRTD